MVRKTVAAVAIVAYAALALARPQFVARIPNGNAGDSPSSGITCKHLGHQGCVAGAERNQFGKDFKAAGLQWTKELCEKDSDGDGVSNGRELGDPCCLWTPNNRNPRGFRVTNLSHPGDSKENGAESVPECPSDAEEGASTPPLPETKSVEPSTVKPPTVKPSTAEPSTKETPEMESGPKEAPKEEIADVKPTESKTAPSPKEKPSAPTPDAPVGSSAPEPIEVEDNSPAESSSCYNKKCSVKGPGKYGGKPCCAGHQCTKAPWEGPSEYRCLPIPPKCYESNARCAGAPNKPYVPYAKCCNPAEACVEGSTDWGSFCKPKPAKKTESAEKPVPSESYEKPTTAAAPVTKPEGYKAPVSTAAPVTKPKGYKAPASTAAPVTKPAGYKKPETSAAPSYGKGPVTTAAPASTPKSYGGGAPAGNTAPAGGEGQDDEMSEDSFGGEMDDLEDFGDEEYADEDGGGEGSK